MKYKNKKKIQKGFFSGSIFWGHTFTHIRGIEWRKKKIFSFFITPDHACFYLFLKQRKRKNVIFVFSVFTVPGNALSSYENDRKMSSSRMAQRGGCYYYRIGQLTKKKGNSCKMCRHVHNIIIHRENVRVWTREGNI